METMEQDWEARAQQLQELQVWTVNHERVKAVMSAMETMEQDWEARAQQLQELQV